MGVYPCIHQVLKYIMLSKGLSFFRKVFYDQFLMHILIFSYLLRFAEV